MEPIQDSITLANLIISSVILLLMLLTLYLKRKVVVVWRLITLIVGLNFVFNLILFRLELASFLQVAGLLVSFALSLLICISQPRGR